MTARRRTRPAAKAWCALPMAKRVHEAASLLLDATLSRDRIQEHETNPKRWPTLRVPAALANARYAEALVRLMVDADHDMLVSLRIYAETNGLASLARGIDRLFPVKRKGGVS